MTKQEESLAASIPIGLDVHVYNSSVVKWDGSKSVSVCDCENHSQAVRVMLAYLKMGD